jgi:ketol-acid reductoisomerase
MEKTKKELTVMKETKIYYEGDGDISVLSNAIIGMIGYGNQGRSQALNMRDSGLEVIIGNRDDDYKVRAKKDGFHVYSIEEAVKRADHLFFLIPDEIMNDVFEERILPHLRRNQSIIFASGYNIAFNLLNPPEFVDVLLIAPRMIGIGVRERFLNKKGYFSFINVHQNVSGNAHQNLLALCKALGTLYLGAIEVTFKEEAVLDLFTEQGFGPSFGRVLLETMATLMKAGYPMEAVLIELILSGQLQTVYKEITKYGLTQFIQAYPKRTQYGILQHEKDYNKVAEKVSSIQKDIIDHIASGGFAEEWEKWFSKLKFKIIKFFAPRVGFGPKEKKVREKLGLLEVDLFEEVDYPTKEDRQKRQTMQEELKDFENYPEY